MTSGEWSVGFYVEAGGANPVEEFLASLDPGAQRRFAWSIEQLRLRNTSAREPLVRHLEGRLWELREESQTNIYRIIYAFFTDQQIVLLHGFQKKTQKTPRREIALAQRRLHNFIQRQWGST